jgi:hypothetical protein
MDTDYQSDFTHLFGPELGPNRLIVSFATEVQVSEIL